MSTTPRVVIIGAGIVGVNLAAVPELAEVSIGHALLADALYLGLHVSVLAYVRACRGEVADRGRVVTARGPVD